MANLTERQRGLMYRLIVPNTAIDITKLNTATVASLLSRDWVYLRGVCVRVTKFGREAFSVEVKRDYNKWVDSLKATSTFRRNAKKAKH